MYFEETIKEPTTVTVVEYKDFAETVKERFIFERSENQKERITDCFKQVGGLICICQRAKTLSSKIQQDSK